MTVRATTPTSSRSSTTSRRRRPARCHDRFINISPDGKLRRPRTSSDRLGRMQLRRDPGSCADQNTPAGTGIWIVDMDTGSSRLILSLEKLANIATPTAGPLRLENSTFSGRTGIRPVPA